MQHPRVCIAASTMHAACRAAIESGMQRCGGPWDRQEHRVFWPRTFTGQAFLRPIGNVSLSYGPNTSGTVFQFIVHNKLTILNMSGSGLTHHSSPQDQTCDIW